MTSILDEIDSNFPDLILSIMLDYSNPDKNNDLLTDVYSEYAGFENWISWFYQNTELFQTLRIRLENKVELLFKNISSNKYLVILNKVENITLLINHLDRIPNVSQSSDSQNEIDQTDKGNNEKVSHKDEIDDKIKDALRIQSLIMPDDNAISTNFKKFFAVHKQQDVVGGDFYWYKKDKNGILLAVIDCTGHSVEGAMTSMVCNSILNQVYSNFDSNKPENFVSAFYEHIENYNKKIKNSMDYGIGAEIGLIYNNDKSEVIKFISTGIAAFLRRNKEIELLKPKKIMDYENADSRISVFDIHKKNLTDLFLFTDGLTDMFDSEDAKKLGYKGIKRMIENESSFDSNYYLDEILKWKGVNMQYDDITLLGIAI